MIHERASRAGKTVIRLIHKACLLFALANQLIVDTVDKSYTANEARTKD